ncbi:hypothetical protein [Dactylosporangium sp. NPDC048998]|uniref:hypothetical protein n=1 Tax=Dactylosporangium sp. NPDC048998 TaxID=3363976 RepID=UPI0037203796
MADQFNFYGQTTFVNRPAKSVVSDFQNRYARLPAADDLSELLRLVLTSAELGSDKRERAARELHGVGAELEQPGRDDGRVRKLLESVQDIVSKAADIALPATSIVSRIMDLVG